jgi:hypothetical protein
MSSRANQVAEILVRAKVIDEFQMRSSLREFEKWGGRYTRIVGELRLAPDERVVAALAEHLKLPPIDLSRVPHDAAALAKLDAEACEQGGVFPCALKDSGKTLWLAMCEPTNFQLVEEIERKTKCRLRLMVAGETALKAAVARHYRGLDKADRNPTNRAAPGSSSIDLTPSTTGEFTDAKGEVLGKLPSSRNKLAPPVDEAPGPQGSAGANFDFVPDAFTPAEVARIEALRTNQTKGTKVLQALVDLCVEKGLMTPSDAERFKA